MKYSIQGNRIVDLSQLIEKDIPGPVGFPNPQLSFFRTIKGGDVINVESIELGLHCCTHIDAPYHFMEEGITIDQVPPEIILGSAVVVDLRHKKGSVPIEAQDIMEWEEKSKEYIRRGDGVLLMTEFSKLWKVGEGNKEFLESGWPYIARSAAQYLLEKKIRLIGVESMDLDLVDPYDLSKSEFVGHRTFLANGIYIVENLKNLDMIQANRCDIVGTPLYIKGGTGSPIRMLALVP